MKIHFLPMFSYKFNKSIYFIYEIIYDRFINKDFVCFKILINYCMQNYIEVSIKADLL